MAKSYSGLMAQIERLQARASRLNKTRAKAIAKVNGLISEFGLEARELAFGGNGRGRPKGSLKGKSVPKRKRAKLAPKYRGPGGATWAGRGLMPVWLRDAVKKGKKKEDFLIKGKRD